MKNITIAELFSLPTPSPTNPTDNVLIIQVFKPTESKPAYPKPYILLPLLSELVPSLALFLLLDHQDLLFLNLYQMPLVLDSVALILQASEKLKVTEETFPEEDEAPKSLCRPKLICIWNRLRPQFIKKLNSLMNS